jgi:hypothetical protein
MGTLHHSEKMSKFWRDARPWEEGELSVSEHVLTNTVYIRTTAHDLWQAPTDGEQSVKYVGARVQFHRYAPDSPTFRFQAQGSMQMCGSSLKSLLETGQPLEFKTPATVDA